MKLYQNRIKFLSTVVFLYVLLFEFVVPTNKYFPKPPIIFDSFGDLFRDYNLSSAMFLTVITVLFTLLFSFLLVYFLRGKIIAFIDQFPNFFEVLNIFKYVPVIIAPIILIFWFGANFISEITYLFFSAIVFWLYKIKEFQTQVSQSYIDSARSIGVTKSKIYKDVYWKCMEPNLMASIRNLNIYLWISAIVFEYIVGFFGLGSIYFQGYMYKDFSAIIALTILISILITIIDGLLSLIKEQTIFWSHD